jgi:hypothetical protein
MRWDGWARSREVGTLRVVTEQSPSWGTDAERPVDFSNDDLLVLPDQTYDDTDRGWGERPDADGDWLVAERPPHWDV